VRASCRSAATPEFTKPLLELAESVIAANAQEPANKAALVIVVYVEADVPAGTRTADCAPAALRRKESLELVEGQPEGPVQVICPTDLRVRPPVRA
jgi:hypothetical protein